MLTHSARILALLAFVTAAAAQSAPAPAPAPGSDAPLARRAKEVAALFTEMRPGFESMFDDSFLRVVPPAKMTEIIAGLRAQLGTVQSVRPVKLDAPNSGMFDLEMTQGFAVPLALTVNNDDEAKIIGLFFMAPKPIAKSLPDLAAMMQQRPGKISFIAAQLPGPRDRQLKVLASAEPDLQLAVGSAFKLYVLGALLEDMELSKRKWTDVVKIRNDWKSLPSGMTQGWPSGAPVTLHSLATLMISISDNTATDHLLRELGRERVEQMLPKMGQASPEKSLPFLTTQEMFKLKSRAGEDVRKEYRKADVARRRELLAKEVAAIDRASLSAADITAKPVAVDSIEWFASAKELAMAMAWIRDHTRSEATIPARDVLAVNPGLSFDKSPWSYVGFKGGSEPGVMNLTYLLERADGTAYAVAATWVNPKAAVDESAWAGYVQAAVELLAKASSEK